MRGGAKRFLTLAGWAAAWLPLVVLALPAVPGAAQTAPGTAPADAPAGITIAPASLRLQLEAGHRQAATSFSVTNGYAGPVSLRFVLEPSDPAAGQRDPRSQLTLSQPDMTIAPGDTAEQTVTVRDADTLEPGSHAVILAVAHTQSAAHGVSLLPGIRLPVTVVKMDGAVTSLRLAGIERPALATRLPHTITVRLKNTGNMITVPRGTVIITGPGGRLLGKGVLNQASLAVAPGATLRLDTAITGFNQARLPGNYRITLSYGRGGDAPASAASVSFWYVAWWHGGVAVLAAAAGWLTMHGIRRHAKRLRSLVPARGARRFPGGPLFSGRRRI